MSTADSRRPTSRSSSSRPTRRSWLRAVPDARSSSTPGDATLDVVVVDNESTDGTRELVESGFPQARVVGSENRGFAHANNRGADDVHRALRALPQPRHRDRRRAPSGSSSRRSTTRPDVGLVGRAAAHRRRHAVADDPLLPERPSRARARRSPPSAGRVRPRWAGERELDLARLRRARSTCDWTSGSFMLARREALLSAGLLDERFFIYSEEPDLCLRMKRAGWAIRHLPAMTIVHHAGKGGLRPKMVAQDAFTRRQYAHKHFAGPARGAYLAAVGARHVVRAVAGPGGEAGRSGARQPPGSPCARSPAARRRRSARRRRPRSAARARASRLPVRRPQPPVRVACVGLRFGVETIGHFVADVRWRLRATRRREQHERDFCIGFPPTGAVWRARPRGRGRCPSSSGWAAWSRACWCSGWRRRRRVTARMPRSTRSTGRAAERGCA